MSNSTDNYIGCIITSNGKTIVIIHNKYCIYKSYKIDHNYRNNKTVLNIDVPSTRDNPLHRAHKPFHKLRLNQEKTNTQKSSKRLQLVDKKSNKCFDKRTRLWWCLGRLSRFSHWSVWWDVQFQFGVWGLDLEVQHGQNLVTGVPTP